MKVILAGLIAACLVPSLAVAQSSGAVQAEVQKLHEGFVHPPDDSRIMMRWWWFGPSATKPEISRELEQMKAAAIG